MDELLRQLTTALRGMWQRRWWGLAVAWVGAVAGAIALVLMPDKYEASARVFVDSDSILKPLMQGLTVQPNIQQQISIVTRTLLSRPNMEKLVRTADLDLGLRTAADKDKLVDELIDTIKFRGAGQNNLYTVSYRDAQPEKARRVVQSLVSMFVESSLGDSRKDADTARRFIEDQIQAYEKKLAEAENRVKEFKLRNMGLMNTDGRDFFARMGAISEQINKTRLELRAAEQSREALKRELEGAAPAGASPVAGEPPALDEVVIPEIDSRLQPLKQGLDDMLRRYTEQHPDVVNTRRIIAELEEQKRKEIEVRRQKMKPSDRGGPLAGNPVAQQLRIALADAEAKVASLRAQLAEYEARFNQARANTQRVPEIEAELAALNRDYEIQKRNYEQLVSRRESVQLAGELDSTAAVVDFRIIDPPRVSPKPVAPNRLLILPGVLLAAIALGAVASFLVSLVLPTVHDGRTLREVSGRPVLGSVGLLPNPALIRRARLATYGFAGGVSALVAVYGVGIAWLALRAPVG
jgi:polysaccharide chain length determinant protein (PEP-CTERM system associated)